MLENAACLALYRLPVSLSSCNNQSLYVIIYLILQLVRLTKNCTFFKCVQ